MNDEEILLIGYQGKVKRSLAAKLPKETILELLLMATDQLSNSKPSEPRQDQEEKDQLTAKLIQNVKSWAELWEQARPHSEFAEGDVNIFPKWLMEWVEVSEKEMKNELGRY